AALPRCSAACVVDENAPHRLRRNSKKVRPVGKRSRFVPEQTQIQFVHQRIRLQSMVRSLASENICCHSAQVFVNSSEQLIAGMGIARSSSTQPQRYWFRTSHLREPRGPL